MSKQLYLMAHFELKQADEFAPIFAEHAKASRAKAGCLFFYLIRDRETPTKFATMECWENHDYFLQHTKDEEHDKFIAKIKQYWKGEPDVMECDLVMGME